MLRMGAERRLLYTGYMEAKDGRKKIWGGGVFEGRDERGKREDIKKTKEEEERTGAPETFETFRLHGPMEMGSSGVGAEFEL